MRKLLVMVIVVLFGVLAGWVSFDRAPGKATINIETNKIQDDTERAVEKGKDLLRTGVEPFRTEVEPAKSEQDPAPTT